ncbi:MAG: MBL fold metallo-hydrolase [Thermoproteota archaeon]
MQGLQRVAIDPTGAIRLGGSIVVDGHDPEAVARVITHIHTDHIRRIRESALELNALVATPLTLDLLAARGIRVPEHKRVGLDYYATFSVAGDSIRLLRANHVPGAAEVLVETVDGLSLGYTGDFKLPGTDIMRDLDVLVIDATYGDVRYRRPWQDQAELILVETVDRMLSLSPVGIYAYNGKVEEVMILLREYGIDAPYILSSTLYRSARVLEKYGFKLGYYVDERSDEASELMRGGPYIRLLPFGKLRSSNGLPGNEIKIILSGWEFSAPVRRLGENEILVSFSDHADFDQLVEYVQEARPRLLVVDSSRGGAAAYKFSRYVRDYLGIESLAMP